MTEAEFAKAVLSLAQAQWDNDWRSYISAEQAGPILDQLGVPEFWREPIRVMASGGHYCSAEEWMEKHARPV